MKKTDFMTMTAAMMLATSACVGPEKTAQTDGPIIGKQEIIVKDGRMTLKRSGPWDASEVPVYRPMANALPTRCLTTV